MDVPEGWSETSFGQFCTLKRGYDLPVQNRRPGPFPVFAANGVVGTHDEAKVRGPGIVTGRSGTIGRVAYVDIDFWPLNTSLYAQDLHGNDPGFIYRFIEWFRLERFATGTGVPTLNRNLVHQANILVPPLAEQRKIAAILSSVDEAIEKTQVVIDQVQVVKKGLMQELLTRGLPGRHKKFKQTEIGEIPESWGVQPTGDVCLLVTKGATPDAEQQRAQGEIPFLKVYNLDPRGFIDFTHRPTYISRDIHSTLLRRSQVYPNDVLMNIVGPPLGKVAIVSAPFAECNINQAIAVFRPSPRLDPRFLHICLSCEHIFKWARSKAKRTSSQLNLTLELCRDLPIPVPPLAEQVEIAKCIRSAHDAVQSEELHLSGLQQLKQALMSVLLTGELRVTP